MNLVFIFLFCLSLNSYASFPEMFGASATTAGVGNQFNNDFSDPANNFTLPASLVFARRPSVSVTSFVELPAFNHISNVQVRNNVNSDENLNGDIDVHNDPLIFNAYHVVLPIMKEDGLKLGVSIFSPAKYLQESNTGDPFATEYVMYRGRLNRTTTYFNLAIPIKDDMGFSVGFYSGFQVAAETDITARYNGSNKMSAGKMKAKATPSISPIVSFIKKFEDSTISLSYIHSMKNKLKAQATGSTKDATLNLPYDLEMNSMMFYDPNIIRLGWTKVFSNTTLLTTIEYQMWNRYKTSVLELKQNSGFLVSSGNYEKVNTRNILVPKIGLEHKLGDFTPQLGFGYRPTPIKGDFSGPGNSVDTDSIFYSGGLKYQFQILGYQSHLAGSLQVHQLKDKNVVKSSGMEDGNPGNKIGSPGYKIGGTIYVAGITLGVDF